MTKHVVSLLWVIVLVCPVLGLAQVPQDEPVLSARFDRTTVFEGDSVVLRIKLTNIRAATEPDFSILGRDFIVGETGTNSSMSIVNGRREFSNEWNVLLEPRRIGEIRVPSLEIAGRRTNPLVLTVMERPDGTGPQGRDVFIEVEATPNDPYVQGQVLFVIRLYHAPAIMEGSLGEPEAVEAVVERLGDDSDYRTAIDGQNYRVIERRYALFPERSGELIIPEIRFQGRVAEQNRQRGFNSLFSRGRLTSVKSDPIGLTVRPTPSDFTGSQWLPAAELTVAEVWPNGEPEFRVGEPVTRSLVTRAKGLLSAQLPAIDVESPEGAKLYPDQPVSQSRTDGTWVVGSREDTFAIVPTAAGTLVLPEVRIPWWDTVNDRLAEAVIPAREYTVLPAAGDAAVPSLGEIELPTTILESSNAPKPTGWRWWRELAWVGLSLWLITLVLYLRARQGRPDVPAGAPQAQERRVDGPRPLKLACRGNDARTAATSLLAWARQDDPECRNLGQLARRMEDAALAEEILELQQTLYGSAAGAAAWTGERLWSLCKGGLRYRQPPKPPESGALPDLYAAR